MFIFDVLPLSKPEKFGLVEVKREEEFAPVKNAPGALEDSPDTARRLLSQLHQNWFKKHGVKFQGKITHLLSTYEFLKENKELENLFEIDFRKVYDERDPQLKTLTKSHINNVIKLPCFIHE